MADLTASHLLESLATIRTRVDAALSAYTSGMAGCPEHLEEAIRYSLLGPGKRLRPAMVLWAAEACGCTSQAPMPAACAVEMIHCYSLIHDDLPAMDNDDLRRGRPTCHKAYGEGVAILAGDALQALAFEVLARDIQPPEVALMCCKALADAAGPRALVGGQADDLANEFGEGGIEDLEAIHRRKTGAMFSVSLRLGALIAGASGEQLRAIDVYGRKVGLVFQIADDLLDVRGDEAAVGKRVGKDQNRGKLTFPGLLGLEESQQRAERLVEEACEAIAPLGPAATKLQGLARYTLERNS